MPIGRPGLHPASHWLPDVKGSAHPAIIADNYPQFGTFKIADLMGLSMRPMSPLCNRLSHGKSAWVCLIALSSSLQPVKTNHVLSTIV